MEKRSDVHHAFLVLIFRKDTPQMLKLKGPRNAPLSFVSGLVLAHADAVIVPGSTSHDLVPSSKSKTLCIDICESRKKSDAQVNRRDNHTASCEQGIH